MCLYKNNNIYKIYIEVEETSARTWPETQSKPSFSSGLLTMPIRKVKYFIKDYRKLELKSFDKINDFTNLFPGNKIFQPRASKDEIRLYVKGSQNLKYICLVKDDIIIKALNQQLVDQQFVNQKIKQLKNPNWKFKGNIWGNPYVKNMNDETRDDKLLLILGTLSDKNNGLIWIKAEDICKYLSMFAKSKWGIQI